MPLCKIHEHYTRSTAPCRAVKHRVPPGSHGHDFGDAAAKTPIGDDVGWPTLFEIPQHGAPIGHPGRQQGVVIEKAKAPDRSGVRDQREVRVALAEIGQITPLPIAQIGFVRPRPITAQERLRDSQIALIECAIGQIHVRDIASVTRLQFGAPGAHGLQAADQHTRRQHGPPPVHCSGAAGCPWPGRWPSRSGACGLSPGTSSRSSPGRRAAGEPVSAAPSGEGWRRWFVRPRATCSGAWKGAAVPSRGWCGAFRPGRPPAVPSRQTACGP